MGLISLNYWNMEDSVRALKSGANTARRYADALNRSASAKMDSIEGGNNGHVFNAYLSVQVKKDALHEKADRMQSLSNAVSHLKEFAQNQDQTVASMVSTKARDFQVTNGIHVGWIESAWNWLCKGVSALFEKSKLGQWVADKLRNFSDWLADKWARLREWFDFKGGKFWVNIGTALLALGAAVVTILGAATGILALIGTIGAVIAAANALVKFTSNVLALHIYKEDPQLADRVGSINTASGLLREGAKNLDENSPLRATMDALAGTIDFVDGFCAMVGFADSVTKIYGKFSGKQSLFQKYLGTGGEVDSLFAKDISGPNSNLRKTRMYDSVSNEWYRLDGKGNKMFDVNGNPLKVDFNKAEKIQLDFKTGWKRLQTTRFPATVIDGQSVKRVTGWTMFSSQFIDDFQHSGGQMAAGFKNMTNSLGNIYNNFKGNLSYDTKTAFNFFSGISTQGRTLAVSLRSMGSLASHHFSSLTGLDKITGYFKNATSFDAGKTIQLVNNIYKFPDKLLKVVTFQFHELGDFSTIAKLVENVTRIRIGVKTDFRTNMNRVIGAF